MTAKTILHRFCFVGLLAIVAGCEQGPPGEYLASAEVQKLSPELQTQVRDLLVKNCGTPRNPILLGAASSDEKRLKRGRDVYLQRCWQCHGVTGDGAGPAAAWLNPRPRDYRRGMFKFTSTPYGTRPRRSDLVRTLRVGVPGTSMPPFNLLPEADIEAVVDYVLVLTHRGELEFQLAAEADASDELPADAVNELVTEIAEKWNDAEGKVVYPLSPEPVLAGENVLAGKKAFLSKGCSKCHGEDGRGLTADNLRGDLKDLWGHATMAADLTSGMLHGGREPLDIYRRISSGINGTPMPGFRDTMVSEPETIWNLVAYVLYVSNRRRAGEIPEAGLPVSPANPAADTPKGD
jgi:mono/diheme cytochrome c family protein